MLMPVSISSSLIPTTSLAVPPLFYLILPLVMAYLWQRTWQSTQTPPNAKVVGWIGLLLNSGQSVSSFSLTTMALDANDRANTGGAWGQEWKSEGYRHFLDTYTLNVS